MKNHIERIYELTNLAILTPSNLIENIKLENYIEIKFYKEETNVICEMTSLEENEEVFYFYEFDRNDNLQVAKILYGSDELEIFNRSKELEQLLNQHEKRSASKKRIS